MTTFKPKVLLVEPDPTVLEMVVEALTRRFEAHITCVADAESCLDVAAVDRHDVIISELELDGWNGVQLAEQAIMLTGGPVVLLADRIGADTAIEALRVGVRDLFVKPFAIAELLDAVERAVRGVEVHRQHATRYRRMRDLVRRVIRERRELNRRMDLICRDLVGAHRRLVHRVLQVEAGAKRTG